MKAAPLLTKLSTYAPDRDKLRARLALPKARPITAFNNEKEILRKGTVLVTDTRLAYIDPLDRMLKTYMFEHMISVDKTYYRGSAVNRRFCKILLFTGFVVLLMTLILDLFDSSSSGFILVYIPALLSMLVGAMVWRDMRPKYRIEWRMRDGSTGKISTEPMFREWMTDSRQRENFMDELAVAINQALADKAWWPAERLSGASATDDDNEKHMSETKPRLTLVTDNYQ